MHRPSTRSGLSGPAALASACAWMLLCGIAPGPAIPDAGPLAAGEVLIEMRELPGRGPQEGVARGVIGAPPERVYRALIDYAHWEEFMPFLERSDARPLPGGAVESRQLLDFPAPTGEKRTTVRFIQRVDETPAGRRWRIEWRSVPGAGNLKEHRGAWELQPFPGGRTLGTCTLYTDPGGLTPDFLMNRATRKMLGWIFKGLRQQVNRGRYVAASP